MMNKLISETIYDLSFSFCKENRDDTKVLAVNWLNQLSYIFKGPKNKNNDKKNDFEKIIKTIISINDSEVISAEKDLCDFLQKYNITKRSTKKVYSDYPLRNTDWPLTYQNKLIKIPLFYISNIEQDVDDIIPIKALLGVLRKWYRILVSHRESSREKRLKSTLDLFPENKYPSILMTPQHTNRLASYHPEIKNSLFIISLIFNRVISVETKEKSKKEIVNKIENSFEGKTANGDYALELISRYAIIEAARNRGWLYCSGSAGISVRSEPASAILTNSQLRCIVTKGAPKNIIKQIHPKIKKPEGLSFYSDRFSQKMKEWGLIDKNSSREPDIVLVFYNDKKFTNQVKNNKLRFVFADAKNNQTDDGLAYIRSAISEMFKYMFSYGHILHQDIDFSADDWSAYFSLFVAQKSNSVDNSSVDIISLDKLSDLTDKWWLKISSGEPIAVNQVESSVKITF